MSTMTPEQACQLAWEKHSHYLNDMPAFIRGFHVGIAYQKSLPGEPATTVALHNPANVRPDQIPAGRRLMTVGEFEFMRDNRPVTKHGEIWGCDPEDTYPWKNNNCGGHFRDWTYCVALDWRPKGWPVEQAAPTSVPSNEPCWAEAPQWANFWAQDFDGKAYWYNGKPCSDRDSWRHAKGDWTMCQESKSNIPWIDSLRERPAKVEPPDRQEQIRRGLLGLPDGPQEMPTVSPAMQRRIDDYRASRTPLKLWDYDAPKDTQAERDEAGFESWVRREGGWGNSHLQTFFAGCQHARSQQAGDWQRVDLVASGIANWAKQLSAGTYRWQIEERANELRQLARQHTRTSA